ncbi:RNA-binding protein [Niastella caeni]|uniref:RNA-binding protein n=1 Tax=Niastella caeni TaxID=2569763 RepID=A0A4S8HAJ6_9BACT|nr:RNA-binding protein [Niastella caeni]THU31109.1 RNA-binding protein [Niastella caeni]
MNIYVSNLSFTIQDEDLRNFFASYGEVTSAQIINDRETGSSRGFGFVEMSDETASKKAIAELDGTVVEGRTINVSEAKPKAGRPGRSNSPFRSNNGDNYNNPKSYNENRY